MNKCIDSILNWTKLLKKYFKEQRQCVFQLLALCWAGGGIFLSLESSSISSSLTTAGTSHRPQNVISKKIHHNSSLTTAGTSHRPQNVTSKKIHHNSSLTTAGTSHRPQNVISKKIHHNYAICHSLPTLIFPLTATTQPLHLHTSSRQWTLW